MLAPNSFLSQNLTTEVAELRLTTGAVFLLLTFFLRTQTICVMGRGRKQIKQVGGMFPLGKRSNGEGPSITFCNFSGEITVTSVALFQCFTGIVMV